MYVLTENLQIILKLCKKYLRLRIVQKVKCLPEHFRHLKNKKVRAQSQIKDIHADKQDVQLASEPLMFVYPMSRYLLAPRKCKRPCRVPSFLINR